MLSQHRDLNCGPKFILLCINRALCVFLSVSGTEARLFLLPGPFLPWCLAFHASGLLGSQLCPFSGSEVPSSYQ